jgi:hypothetical protein
MFTRGRNKKAALQHEQLLEPAYAEAEPQLDDAIDAGHPFAEPAEGKSWDFPFAPPPLGPEDLATRALPRFFGGGSPRPLVSSASA